MTDTEFKTVYSTTTETFPTASAAVVTTEDIQGSETSNVSVGAMSNIDKPFRTTIRGKKTNDRDNKI